MPYFCFSRMAITELMLYLCALSHFGGLPMFIRHCSPFCRQKAKCFLQLFSFFHRLFYGAPECLRKALYGWGLGCQFIIFSNLLMNPPKAYLLSLISYI